MSSVVLVGIGHLAAGGFLHPQGPVTSLLVHDVADGALHVVGFVAHLLSNGDRQSTVSAALHGPETSNISQQLPCLGTFFAPVRFQIPRVQRPFRLVSSQTLM